jgi:para-nitrobenzyl esterase
MSVSTEPVVVTRSGRVRGRSEGKVSAFLGIPYAAPPTGSRRWAAPEPAEPWSGTRDALAFGPAAPQHDGPIGLWAHGPAGRTDEDCLSLNVWTPGGEGDRKPVMVWLHGGGWAVGLSGSALYGGAALAAAADAVVITINYRLGTLGWLNHPSLGANWGLLDMAAALRWVRDNAVAFGGDPDAVTLWGQSAGAGSVLHLLCSPLGEGLFSRAIVQSPPLGEVTVPRELGTAWAEALSARVGGGGSGGGGSGGGGSGDGGSGGFDVSALRGASAEAILDCHEALLGDPRFRGTRGGAMPVVDASTLPADPRAVPETRLQIPVLIGTTVDEATFLFRAAGRVLEPEDGQLVAIVAGLPDVSSRDQAEAEIATERARDGGADNNAVLCRLATRHLFVEPVTEWADARARAGGEVHRYSVAFTGPDPSLGATHTIDVSLVFGTFGTEIGTGVSGGGARAAPVSAGMICAWREFVHGRRPWEPGVIKQFG